MKSCVNYNIDTRILTNGIIEMELRTATETLSRWVMDTRDEATRKALIALGWTPPTNKRDGPQMTDLEINQTIAGLMCLEYHKPSPEELASGSYYQYEPDYVNDLNAIHGAAISHGDGVIKAMRGYLWEICGQMRAHEASARERCEAFLSSLDLWRD